MKTILTFLQTYWYMFVIILPFIIFLFVEWKRGKKELVKQIIYYLVCQAEQQFGAKTGDIKFAMVWGRLYASLPWFVRFVFPEATLKSYIKEMVELLKKQLQNKDFNLLTYNQEVETMIKPKLTTSSSK